MGTAFSMIISFILLCVGVFGLGVSSYFIFEKRWYFEGGMIAFGAAIVFYLSFSLI